MKLMVLVVGLCLVLIVGLCLAVARCGGEASDQPSYTPVGLEKVPAELLRNISAGFPEAKLDRAAQISSEAGAGYRVTFHDTRGIYSIDFIEQRGGTEQPSLPPKDAK